MRANLTGALLGLLLALPCVATAQCPRKLLSVDLQPGDEFGSALRLHGDSLLVGAYEHDQEVRDGGAVYAFERVGVDWRPTQKLLPHDLQAGDWFGFALGRDARRAVISSFGWNGQQGKAYVFRLQDGRWRQEAMLVAADGRPGDWFGVSVALLGNLVVVGASQDDFRGRDSGSAYVFRRQDERWQQVARLNASDPVANSRFGFSVALSERAVLVGSYTHTHGNVQSGAAYVFPREGDGLLPPTELLPPDGGGRKHFGIAVAAAGDRLLIGARQDGELAPRAGAAYLFRHHRGQWLPEQKLLPRRAGPDWEFGNKVALHGDRALVGSYLANQLRGRAFLFEREGDGWVQRLNLSAPDRSPGDLFGHDTSVHGEYAAVGAFLSGGDRSGAAYLFPARRIHLAARSGSVRPDQAVELEACGGPPGAPFLLVLSSWNGKPVSRPVGGGVFDAAGEWHHRSPALPRLPAEQLELRILALDSSGNLRESTAARLTR